MGVPLSAAPIPPAGPGPVRAVPAEVPAPLRIGFFGAFYPMTVRAGGASTGMALLLSGSPRLREVTVFGPTVSRLPPGADPNRIHVVPIWTPDRLSTLWRSLRAMAKAAPSLDGFIFSIYVTAFGRRLWVNAAGLMLPVLLRRLTGKPVIVFMHSFVETQEVGKLGYHPSRITLRSARMLERWLLRSTTAVVGLRSMQEAVLARVGGPIRYVPMRHTEAVNPWTARNAVRTGAPEARGPFEGVRVLLFGAWGPQKDLSGAVGVLQQLRTDGLPLRVTVAGGSNPNFPEFEAELTRLKAAAPPPEFRFLGHVADEMVPELFESHDVLLLPYKASGGYSGVMNIASSFGMPIIAYDVPELRENAALLELEAAFVPPRDVRAMGDALRALGLRNRETPAASGGEGTHRFESARKGIEELLNLVVEEGSAA